MAEKKDRLNETRLNNNGEEMRIIRYGGAMDIDIQFEDGTVIKHRAYGDYKRGYIKNPMKPTVCGVGFIGVGKFKTTNGNGKHTKCHKTWLQMHTRCYNPKFHEKEQSYENCTVCEEWHNYQAFAKWNDENYYEVENEQMDLDKDILKKGNKIYSPDTCIYVPHSINVLFVKRDKCRGELPIGVIKEGNKFRGQLKKGNEEMYLGAYTTPEEAFEVYKRAKEEYIKEVAEKYKSQIPQKLYEALINYEVEIDD